MSSRLALLDDPAAPRADQLPPHASSPRPEFLPKSTPAVGSLWADKNAAAGGLTNIKTFEPLTIRGVEFKVGRRPSQLRPLSPSEC